MDLAGFRRPAPSALPAPLPPPFTSSAPLSPPVPRSPRRCSSAPPSSSPFSQARKAVSSCGGVALDARDVHSASAAAERIYDSYFGQPVKLIWDTFVIITVARSNRFQNGPAWKQRQQHGPVWHREPGLAHGDRQPVLHARRCRVSDALLHTAQGGRVVSQA